VTPSLSQQTAEQIAHELSETLARRYPDVRWDVSVVRDSAPGAVHLTELMDAARERLIGENWHLVILITDLPLRLARRPVLTHTSPTHGVAVISLPALGAFQVRRRLVEEAAAAVGHLVGDPPARRPGRRLPKPRPRVQKRLSDLAKELETGFGVAFVARVISGHLRLILGMIRANHPWRMVARLSRALIGAIATTGYTLVNSDVWRIAASLGPIRLSALAVAATTGAVVTVIAAHELWERPRGSPLLRQVTILFNITTLATVVFGICTLYLAVFLVILAVGPVLIDSHLFAATVSHSVGLVDYVSLAWLCSTLATVGGALGASLETDAAVREAAYGYRVRPRGAEFDGSDTPADDGDGASGSNRPTR
jgi:hypothetical protein